MRDVVDSLDMVHWRQSLDVTMLKDRLAVKQKGKRQSAAVQRKINTSPRVQVTRPAANSFKILIDCSNTCMRAILPRFIQCRALPSVRPSVRLSVKRVNCDKTKESAAEILIRVPYKRLIHLVFSQENGLWGTTFSTRILGQTDPVASATPISSRYPLVALQW